ncbi:2-hydroxy-6-oxononadienedioate/2-hydroxy-6-oxononatrienedioate hydrolase-like isoform X2 [Mangifera indica]|uniref:2-hydroxy-6-oxononadienedioate/2-hydroxy-6- oxononatrienedioate hydrolase-like isoform X2 n=1 Tax=Mangifera indica TaxID=29780 RepID=UPI001CFB905D|nr:2-hydroxy-6-oxononadienedioate/2-hydroxy-6-oxononatrienedioate hydrolase-like isoform X2 [Mangifera indica]
MAPFFLSFASLYSFYLRRCFTASGLAPQTLDLKDGTTIHFWGPNPDQKTLRKPSLVLIHGFGPAAIWQWRKQVQFFSPDFHVYVPDLVFFGNSTTKSAERSEVFQAVCVGKLLETIGVKKFAVMGTSYGGFVAYHMAKMWPDKVEKVVIASSGVNMKRSDNDALLKRAKVESIEHLMLPKTPSQLRTLASLAVSMKLSIVPDFFLNDFIEKLYSDNRKEKIQLLKGITLGKDDTAKLSPLQQNVLILWGDHDQIFPLKMAMELKEYVSSSICQPLD